jgi:hypothetical protein
MNHLEISHMLRILTSDFFGDFWWTCSLVFHYFCVHWWHDCLTMIHSPADEETDLVTLIFKVSPLVKSMTLHSTSEMEQSSEDGYGNHSLEPMHLKLMDVSSRLLVIGGIGILTRVSGLGWLYTTQKILLVQDERHATLPVHHRIYIYLFSRASLLLTAFCYVIHRDFFLDKNWFIERKILATKHASSTGPNNKVLLASWLVVDVDLVWEKNSIGR